jgi:hypothetical protein
MVVDREALFKAAEEKRPRIIVFTLKHAKTPQDDVNLAMVTAVLTEIKQFAEYARMHQIPVSLGVLVDELHTFVRKSHSTSVEMIHDLMFAWGRTSKLWRIYMTQKQEQLPKTFRDVIESLKLGGTFQNIISCQHVPTPGFGKFLDRLHARDENSPVDETPRFYPKVKFMPPLCEVESDFLNDDDWKHYWMSKLAGKPCKPRTSPERPWEEIVVDMIATGKIPAGGARPPARKTMTSDGIPLLQRDPRDIREVNEMWANIRRSLGHRVDT